MGRAEGFMSEESEVIRYIELWAMNKERRNGRSLPTSQNSTATYNHILTGHNSIRDLEHLYRLLSHAIERQQGSFNSV